MQWLIAAIIMSIFACKEGDIGPQGPAGVQGEQGIVGAKGADGSVVFSGIDVPATSIGKNGDYYFRTNTGVLYGPKAAGGWGTGTNLKGGNGTAGSKILNGTAIPATTVGAVGDFYFQTNNYLFYGPKTAAGWGTAVNLRGATGSANVIYSGWLLARNFRDSTIDGSLTRIGHVYAPRITTDVINRAVVLVYMNFGGGTFQLPYTSFAAGKASTISSHLKANEIVVQRFTHDGTNSISLSTALSYRYVIIPGSIVAGLRNRTVDFNDYFSVEKALSEIKD